MFSNAFISMIFIFLQETSKPSQRPLKKFGVPAANQNVKKIIVHVFEKTKHVDHNVFVTSAITNNSFQEDSSILWDHLNS